MVLATTLSLGLVLSAPQNVVADCDMQAPPPVRSQDPSGCWHDDAAPAAGEFHLPANDLRPTAWMCLSLLADGSTGRSGPYRVPIRHGVRWLLRHQDGEGRIALGDTPGWLVDHTLGALVLAEASANRSLVRPAALRAAGFVDAHLERLRPAHVDRETLLWAALLGQTWQRLATENDDEAAVLGATLVREATARWPQTAPTTRREQAAALAWKVAVRGDAMPASDPVIADVLAHADDPLACFYVTLAAWLDGGPTWQRVSRRLTDLVAEPEPPDHQWPAAPSVGGVASTSAVNVLILTLYYRYCHLQLAAAPR